MEEKMIRCPRCHREQPESLGACDFCTEARMAWVDEQIALEKERNGDMEEEDAEE